IRVFPGPFGNAAATEPITNQETLRTGFAGRPSSRHLLEAEMKRRAKVGDLKSSLRQEAKELADWLRLMHSEFPPAMANTIRNSLADLYRGASRSGAPRVFGRWHEIIEAALISSHFFKP